MLLQKPSAGRTQLPVLRFRGSFLRSGVLSLGFEMKLSRFESAGCCTNSVVVYLRPCTNYPVVDASKPQTPSVLFQYPPGSTFPFLQGYC
jgi:hypothetical protein